MPGKHATLISEVPARRGYTLTWSFDPGTVQHHCLHILERDTVLDNARTRFTAKNGATLTGTIGKATSGTALSAATAVTGTVDFDGGTVDTNYDFSLVTSKGVPSENLVPAGSAITLNFSGAPAGALGIVTVTLRLSDNF